MGAGLDAVSRLGYMQRCLVHGLAERQRAANGVVFPSGLHYAEMGLGYESATAEGRPVGAHPDHARPAALPRTCIAMTGFK
jgi:hypothetical protein